MPGKEIAEYGVAVFAIAGLIYIVSKCFEKRTYNDLSEIIKTNTKALEQMSSVAELSEVVKNNTKALEQVTSVVQAIQLSLARQETKIDELLERARK